MREDVSYWAIVPAAGIGRRMTNSRPKHSALKHSLVKHPLVKQYLPLLGQTVVEHSIARLLDQIRIQKVLVAINPQDETWPQLGISREERVEAVVGGDERCHSVRNALQALENRARPNDWVLVHDAVRPCITGECIQRLVETLADHPVGGLLGHPLSDTVKRVDAAAVVEQTVDRSALWAASTPQMFRYSVLRKALDKGDEVTDEAMAVEALGLRPQLVLGRRDNLKITVPGDLELAALILQSQQLQQSQETN